MNYETVRNILVRVLSKMMNFAQEQELNQVKSSADFLEACNHKAEEAGLIAVSMVVTQQVLRGKPDKVEDALEWGRKKFGVVRTKLNGRLQQKINHMELQEGLGKEIVGEKRPLPAFPAPTPAPIGDAPGSAEAAGAKAPVPSDKRFGNLKKLKKVE